MQSFVMCSRRGCNKQAVELHGVTIVTHGFCEEHKVKTDSVIKNSQWSAYIEVKKIIDKYKE